MNLGDITTINAGYPFRGKIPEVNNSGVRVIQMKDIDANYSIHWGTVAETQLTGRQTPNWLKRGDILFAARGQRNYAAMVNDTMNGFNAVAAPQFFIIRLNGPGVLPEYLTWFLNQFIAQRYFASNAEGSSTPSIRRSVLEATPIVLPSMAQQKTITALTEAINKERKLAEKIITNSEQLMQCLLRELSHQCFDKEETVPC